MIISWFYNFALCFENENTSVIVDPTYTGGDGDYFIAAREPGVVLISSDTKEHFDPDLILHYAETRKSPILFLVCESVYEKMPEIPERHNVVKFTPHSVYSEKGITFYATSSSDPKSIGCILDDGEKTYYVSGGTLYNFDVIDEVLELVEEGVDCAFLPIGAKGNKMNAKDSSDFAYEIGARCAVPVGYNTKTQDRNSFDFDDARFLDPFVGEEF